MRILIFDSGLGGLSVFTHVIAQIPGAGIIYVADNAGFPYGRWKEEALTGRITALWGALIEEIKPDIGVIACNTASTIALKVLRNRFDIPFIGTVPAIKVAAMSSQSRMFSVLATPGTVKRVYTQELVEHYAPDCRVKLVGAKGLAGLAEAKLRGVDIPADHIAGLIGPAFAQEGDQRTDMIVLACTHYPLLMSELEKASPWPVHFIDPAPAIAQQVARVAKAIDDTVGARDPLPPRIIFTADIGTGEALTKNLERYRFALPPKILPGWDTDRSHDGISG